MEELNFNFSCNKNASKKRLKLFAYLKYLPIVFYSYKKHILQRKTKLSEKTNLTVIYTFHMVN